MTTSEAKQALSAALDHWIKLNLEFLKSEREYTVGSVDAKIRDKWRKDSEKGALQITMRMAKRARKHLTTLLGGNGDKTAEQLEEIASCLSPGGVHDGGLLTLIVIQNIWFADDLMVAALINHNWGGGKRGFQFMPLPSEITIEDYADHATALMERLDQGTWGDPRRILTGNDRLFYDSLPDRFTVYRGCGGISQEFASAGVCWTTRRDVAEWFACRGLGDPIVVTARVRKDEVRLAGSTEFEVVCTPVNARRIKYRARKKRPDEVWRPAATASVSGDVPQIGAH